MSLVGCVSAITLQYVGTGLTTAANVSLIVGLETSIVVLLAALFLSEPLAGRDVGSLLLALLGVIIITVDPASLDLFGSKHFAGNVLVLSSILCYSVYTIVGKMLAGRWGATALTALPFALAAALFVPAYWWLDPAGWQRGLSLTRTECLGVFFLTVPCTALGYLGWNWLLRWMSAGTLSFFLYLQPLAGAIFSAWLLRETMTGTFFLGGAIIFAGIMLGHRSPPKEPPGSFLKKTTICTPDELLEAEK